MMRAIDLFSGAGGLSCGFEWAGGHVVGGIEYDQHAAATFAANHPDAVIWNTDIRTVSPRDVRERLGQIDVVLGGPMCQGVSQRGRRDPHDPRNFAFWTFADFVREIQPHFFVMENVSSLVSDVHNRDLAIAVFKELEELGYHLSAEVLNAAWFGVPQLRYRLVVVGSRDQQLPFPRQVERGILEDISSDCYTTVGEAISDLPFLEPGGDTDSPQLFGEWASLSSYALMCRENADACCNHWSADTKPINLKRIEFVSEGGNWHDIPQEFLPPRFQRVRPSDHTTTYRRLHRDHPAYTITTECGNVTSGAYTHPTQNRAISVREAARLQGFPDRFRFIGPKSSQYRQVGNAVPPLMAKIISEQMILGSTLTTSEYCGRLSRQLLQFYPAKKLPFSLAPRYQPLFGRSAGVLKRLASENQGALDIG